MHTVSPASGYTQADVTSFARILTGWSIEMNNDPVGFVFRPRIHEPGQHALMGRTFPEGEDGGIEALKFLANHPSTHRFLAARLVRHFVADTPPPAAVRRIEGILRDTRGDIGAAAAGLVGLEEAWSPGTKIRAPLDLVVASFRALEVPVDPPPPFIGILAGLGQPLWSAPSPTGGPTPPPIGPAPIHDAPRRLGLCRVRPDRRTRHDGDRRGLARPALRPETRDAMTHAASRREAVTLLLTSPEFQRR